MGSERQPSKGRRAERGPDRRASGPQTPAKGGVTVRLATAVVLIGGMTACDKQQATRAPVTEAEASTIAERAEASFTTGDVNAIMNQYANGAVMIDASNPAPSTDRKVQTGWARTFVS